jgi:4-hydroxybutyrate CoA-transferase
MSRVVSAHDAIGRIKAGARVLFGSAEPTVLVSALLDDIERLRRVEIISGFSLGDYPFLGEGFKDRIDYTTWQINPRAIPLVRSRRVRFVPLALSRIPSAVAPGGPLFPDVFLVQTSPPDDKGNLSLGSSVGFALGAATNTPMVIAQINPRVPRTVGRTTIPVSRVECMVESDVPLLEMAEKQSTESDRRIAELVADLIPDGATVELGVGGIPNSVYHALHEKKNLGIHSGMVSDGIIGLVESGAVTGRNKSIDRGRIVVAEAVGTRRLYEYIDGNVLFSMQPYDYTHDQSNLVKLDNFHAVNSAIEVDLAGQVNAESIAGMPIGAGGILDFSVAAYISRGGRSIIALPSTRKRGEVSTILSRFAEGTPVTLPKGMVDYVVTEFGVARLRGASVRERAEALATIAHPDHRDGLMEGIVRLTG